jgi:hypothetical protein
LTLTGVSIVIVFSALKRFKNESKENSPVSQASFTKSQKPVKTLAIFSNVEIVDF